MKKIQFAILYLIIISNVYSRTSEETSKFTKYEKLTFVAKIYYVDKDYKNALNYYIDALKIIPDDLPDVYFEAATCALHLKNYEEAKKLIYNAIIQVDADKGYFLRFKGFDPFRKHKIFREIDKNYSFYRKKFFANLKNPKIHEEIEQMFKRDQSVRKANGYFKNVDIANIDRLIEITKQYGWQKRGWLILWHQRDTYGTDNYIWSFFKPYIDDQIKKGNISKSFWARFDDESSIIKNEMQIYGMYWSQFEQFPIRNIENVDKQRKDVGLPPLWYMGKTLCVKLPTEYTGTPENSPL